MNTKKMYSITFRSVVAAKSFVDFAASSTFVIDITALNIRKYTTASTATVTLSLVKISCGGTSKVTVRRSTLLYVSIHGKIKNRPKQ